MELSRGKTEDYEYIRTDMDDAGIHLKRRVSDGRMFTEKHVPKEAEEVYIHLKENHYKGVPEVIDIRDEGSCLLVTEEYIEGRDLRTFLEGGHIFSEKEAVDIIISLIMILRPLHQHHPPIIHRDIKPENIILDRYGKVWLIDWGAAKKETYGRSRDTVLMGTEGYAAPEQYGFSFSDPSTDIYAIGVLLNELITGKLPSEGKCTGRLRAVVDKCTELEKSNRYENVDQLKKALIFRKPHKWLLPGFRGKGIGLKVISAFLYYMLAYGTLNMDVSDSKSTADTVLNRIFSFILFFSLVLFFGNWGDMWSRLPLMRSPMRNRKVTGLIIWPIMITSAVMTVFSLSEMLFV
ncbi:MAG: serine/threonine protein kinase [Bullifex sp.]